MCRLQIDFIGFNSLNVLNEFEYNNYYFIFETIILYLWFWYKLSPDPYKVRIGGIFKISVFIYSIYLIIPDNLYKVVGYLEQNRLLRNNPLKGVITPRSVLRTDCCVMSSLKRSRNKSVYCNINLLTIYVYCNNKLTDCCVIGNVSTLGVEVWGFKSLQSERLNIIYIYNIIPDNLYSIEVVGYLVNIHMKIININYATISSILLYELTYFWYFSYSSIIIHNINNNIT